MSPLRSYLTCLVLCLLIGAIVGHYCGEGGVPLPLTLLLGSFTGALIGLLVWYVPRLPRLRLHWPTWPLRSHHE